MPKKLQVYSEALFMLASLQLVAFFTMPEDMFFTQMPLSPYWLIILLISFRYGEPYGQLISLICAGLTLWGYYQIDNNVSDMLYLHTNKMIIPVSMIMLGHYCSEALNSRDCKTTFFKTNLQKTKEELEINRKNYLQLEEKYRFLESNIAGREGNLFRMHGPIKRLNSVRNKEELITCLKDSLSEILHAEDISIYEHHNGDWLQNNKLIEETNIPALLRKSMQTKSILSCTTKHNPNIPNDAILAGVVYNRKEKLIMGITVGMIPFKNMASLSVDVFETILHWVGMSLDRIEIMQAKGSHDFDLQELGLNGENFFCDYVSKSIRLLAREAKPATILSLSLQSFSLNRKAHWRLEMLISHIILKIARGSDLLTYNYPQQTFLLYLPSTNIAGANVVKEKILNTLAYYKLMILNNNNKKPIHFADNINLLEVNNLPEFNKFQKTFYKEL